MSIKKIRSIYDEMCQANIERDEPIKGILLGLICGVNVAFLGPPGTAKSYMVNDLCNRIGGKYFSYLFTKFTTPEEIFGTISLKELENDRHIRVTTGKLPEADIGFADEGFKASSAIINAMLKIINPGERVYDRGDGERKVPLRMMVLASNELPVKEEHLEAFWDRFLLRYEVGYIKSRQNFIRMLEGQESTDRTTITIDELDRVVGLVNAVDIPANVREGLSDLWNELARNNIIVSDRRYKESLKLLKGVAAFDGRDQAVKDDLEIMLHCFWEEPEQIPMVRKILLDVVNPLGTAALDEYDMAVEVYNNVLKVMADNPIDINAGEQEMQAKMTIVSKEGLGANVKLKTILYNLEKIRTTAKSNGKSTTQIDGYIKDVERMNKEVTSKCLRA